LLRALEKDILKNGGFTESLYRIRSAIRNMKRKNELRRRTICSNLALHTSAVTEKQCALIHIEHGVERNRLTVEGTNSTSA